jgi:hypothetical protein
MARQQQPTGTALLQAVSTVAGGCLRDLLVEAVRVPVERSAEHLVCIQPLPGMRRAEPSSWTMASLLATVPPSTGAMGSIPSPPTVPTSMVPPCSRGRTIELLWVVHTVRRDGPEYPLTQVDPKRSD